MCINFSISKHLNTFLLWFSIYSWNMLKSIVFYCKVLLTRLALGHITQSFPVTALRSP